MRGRHLSEFDGHGAAGVGGRRTAVAVGAAVAGNGNGAAAIVAAGAAGGLLSITLSVRLSWRLLNSGAVGKSPVPVEPSACNAFSARTRASVWIALLILRASSHSTASAVLGASSSTEYIGPPSRATPG